MCQLNQNAGYINLNKDVRLQGFHNKQTAEWCDEHRYGANRRMATNVIFF